MPKVNRGGQATILSEKHREVIERKLRSPYDLIFTIGRYTGERGGAICSLAQENCYDHLGAPRDLIIFPSAIRKHSAGKKPPRREVPCHPILMIALEKYDRPDSHWMFPMRSDPERHIDNDLYDANLRRALKKLGLEYLGITTHSTRRTVITELYERGVDIKVIMQFSGHKSISSLMRYIEVNPDRVKEAVNLIK